MLQFEKFNLLGKTRDAISSKVNESRIPTEDYESTVGVFGGKIRQEKDGKMVWNNEGVISRLDKWGDALLRTYDDHVVKRLGELLRRHPRLFFYFLAPGSKRYRGNQQEIYANIQRLGLEDTYGLHEHGIEIKDQDLYRKGISLQDLCRSDLIGSEKLEGLNYFQAVKEAARYLRQIHDSHGGIGEVLPSDIIFKDREGNKVINPVLNLPDIVFNKEKNIGEKEKKATDLLDFVMSVGAEEFRRSNGQMAEVRDTIDIVLDNYGDSDVISLLESYIKRGRLTLSGDKEVENIDLPQDGFTTKNRGLFTKHNEARVINNRSLEAELKEVTLELCREYRLYRRSNSGDEDSLG